MSYKAAIVRLTMYMHCSRYVNFGVTPFRGGIGGAGFMRLRLDGVGFLGVGLDGAGLDKGGSGVDQSPPVNRSTPIS